MLASHKVCYGFVPLQESRNVVMLPMTCNNSHEVLIQEVPVSPLIFIHLLR